MPLNGWRRNGGGRSEPGCGLQLCLVRSHSPYWRGCHSAGDRSDIGRGSPDRSARGSPVRRAAHRMSVTTQTATPPTMTSVPEWDRRFRLVRVHHEHREELGRLSLAGIGADAVAVAGQLREALSGLVGRHRLIVDLTADLPPSTVA